jgi:hypothetical protein
MYGRLTKFQLRVRNWVGAQKRRQRTYIPSARRQCRIAEANWQFFRLMLLFVKLICHFCVVTATYCSKSQSRLGHMIIVIRIFCKVGRNGSISPRLGASSGCGWRGRRIESSCKYTEWWTADSRQGVVLWLEYWTGTNKSSHYSC